MARKTAAKKNYLVFISHSMKDRWIAKQIANLIEEKGRKYGVKVFLDERDIKSGESIPETIRKNIRACGEFLVLLTPNSINRPWVLLEIGGAWQLGKHIIAIIDKVSPEQMPDVIALHKAIDLNDFDEYFEHVINRAKEARK